MATQTSGAKTTELERQFAVVQSDKEVIADTIVLEGLSGDKPHTFIGAKFFDGGGDPVVPSAGTVTITVETINNGQWEAIPDNTIDATSPTTVSVGANLTRVRAVPTGLAGAVTWRLVATQNRS